MFTPNPKVASVLVQQKNTAYVSFKLTKDLDIDEGILAFSLIQQGDRLSKYRPDDKKPCRFYPSPSSLMLLSTDGEIVEHFDQ
jgi:hypothetical protein